jgi:hypothetical protein
VLEDCALPNSGKELHNVGIIAVCEDAGSRECWPKQVLRPEHVLLLPCLESAPIEAVDEEYALETFNEESWHDMPSISTASGGTHSTVGLGRPEHSSIGPVAARSVDAVGWLLPEATGGGASTSFAGVLACPDTTNVGAWLIGRIVVSSGTPGSGELRSVTDESVLVVERKVGGRRRLAIPDTNLLGRRRLPGLLG